MNMAFLLGRVELLKEDRGEEAGESEGSSQVAYEPGSRRGRPKRE
jgi:hypothetical protein